jgi:hypothetical protein
MLVEWHGTRCALGEMAVPGAPLERGEVMNGRGRTIAAVLLSLLIGGAAFADTLTLKDGRVLRGRYLGGTQNALRFEVKGEVQTFNVADVVGVTFTPNSGLTNAPDAAAPPAATPPPTPDAPPADPNASANAQAAQGPDTSAPDAPRPVVSQDVPPQPATPPPSLAPGAPGGRLSRRELRILPLSMARSPFRLGRRF